MKEYKDILPKDVSDYKKGLSIQREIYKNANLNNDYDTMVRCLENLVIELKTKAENKNNKEDILKIKKIIKWYKNLPLKYSIKTEEGNMVKYPYNIHIKISSYLNLAYEKIINIMIILDLL